MTVSSREAARICPTLLLIAFAGFPSSAPGQDRRSASSPAPTTVVACVGRSADYVRTTTAPAGAPQFLLTDVRSGVPTHNLTGVREQDLMPYVGQRVEITGTIERARTTPVLTTAEGAVAGSVNSEQPPAAGVTPEGAAAHEPADALAATVPTGRVTEPTRVSDPAYLVAVLPALNATAFRRVAGTCAAPPADRPAQAAANDRLTGQRPAVTALPQQQRQAERVEPVTARGCLVRQTPGGTALTPQGSPADVFVLADASLVTSQVEAPRRGAVPGSAPANAGSGTVPPAAGTSGQAPVDAGTVSFTLSLASGNTRELVQHVGDRVEVTGTLEASARSESGDRPSVGQDPGAGGRGRVQVAPIEVAHVSTPARRILVTMVRPVGGACN
jgi:hypothetical protein